MYYEGGGTPQNLNKVFKWTKKSANQGDAKAQSHLTLMHQKGESAIEDSANTNRVDVNNKLTVFNQFSQQVSRIT